MRTPTGFYTDQPAFPIIETIISYWNVTSGAGNALGTTVICANLANEPNYAGLPIKVLDGPAAGQVRIVASHIGATITVAAAFTNAAGVAQQIAAGTRFVILSIAGGGGASPAPPSPGIGLWMFGVCDPGMAASLNTLVLTNLAGFNNDIFNNEFWIQVIHNASAPGTAPEREIRRVTDYVGATGTFTTDAFSANVEANDLVCVFHESIMGIEIVGYGTLDTSSITVPADSARAAAYPWENNNYFRGCLLMPTEGNDRFQPRRIVVYTAATGVFTLDPNNPFSQLPGMVDYVIIRDQCGFVPAADGANNVTPEDVIGNKTDTAAYVLGATESLMRYLKGLHGAAITATGTADAGSTAGLVRDAARTEIDDWWNGQTLLMLTGTAAGQKRPITDFAAATDDIIVSPDFDQVIGVGDVYVILAHYNQIVPRTADSVLNALTSQVVGRKDDTALAVVGNVASLMRYVKGIIGLLSPVDNVFKEQADVAVNINAILAAETDVLNLAVAATRYIVRSLRLKSADPGANTVTVRLYGLVNDGLILVDSFAITTANFGTYYSLMDMFGLPYLAGDRLQVTVQASAGGPYVVTGQYSHGLAT